MDPAQENRAEPQQQLRPALDPGEGAGKGECHLGDVSATSEM